MRRPARSLTTLVILTAVIVGTSARPAVAQKKGDALSHTAAHVEEQLLLSGDPVPFSMSLRGSHVAARVLKGSRSVIVHDGVAGPPFDEIPSIPGESAGGVFSDDGTHHAYVARQGQQWVVMEDGKEVARGGPFTVNSNPTVSLIGFTPGGKHLYFSTYDAARQVYQFYFDAKPDPAIHGNAIPVLSADGEHYAYEFNVNTETGNPQPALMVDGKRAAYAGTDPRFTADGLHLYTKMTVPRTSTVDVLLDGKAIMRVNGATLRFAPAGSGMLASVLAIGPKGERGTFLTIGNKRVPNSDCHGSIGSDTVYFSADVKHFAVRCQESSTSYWVMADGKKGQEYQGIVSGVSLTTDGRPVYMALANAKQFIVAGDQEFGPYASVQLQPPAGVNNLRGVPQVPFVVAGNHFGFIAMDSPTFTLNRLVVVDGKATKAVGASDLAFSADGSRFAYLEQGRTVVVDGTQRISAPLAHENDDVPAKVVFSQDGKHFAFTAAAPGAQGRGVAIDDGVFITGAMSHYDVTFTPDGRHLVWNGNISGGRRRVFMDGEPVLEFDQLPGSQESADSWWSMGADGVLTFIALDNGTVKRYRITPGNSSIDARSKR